MGRKGAPRPPREASVAAAEIVMVQLQHRWLPFFPGEQMEAHGFLKTVFREAAHGQYKDIYQNTGIMEFWTVRAHIYIVSLEIILMHFLSLRMGLDMANKLEDHGCISLFL
jgi:hypothetical protein